MTKLIICPNEEKMKLLEENNNLEDIKYMTKEEYLKHYYYEYDEKAIYYLMNKYKYNIDVAKVYLDNMIYIDIDKKYKNNKINFLKDLKKDCINNNLFIYHSTFKEYIKDKIIEIRNVYNLNKYEEIALSYKEEYKEVELNNKVYKFNSIEQEVNYICNKIIELLNKGISINKIYLTNVSKDYYYILWKLFNYYNIPIEIPFNDSIYTSSIVQQYLSNKELPTENNQTTKKLYNVLNSLSDLPQDEIYECILKDKLKNTNYNNIKLDNAIRIKDIKKYTFKEDEYVFLLNFNQDALPNTVKDIDYLSDKEKEEVDLYTSVELNKKERKLVPYLLSKINNLTITYKTQSPFNEYYPSSIIKDYNLEEIEVEDDKYNYSNIYNEIRLGEMLDKFHIYGEKNKILETLYSNYDNKYDTYSNKYTGINNDLYLENLKVPLKLSFTSINSYNECAFKYYIKNVLKIEDYTQSFQAFIGSMYHEILTLYKKNTFNIEEELKKYLEKRELSLKEQVLLTKIKEDLVKLIEVLKKQQLLTGYDEEYYEKYLSIPLREDIQVELIGYIDKIMFYKKVNDTYFSIIDYKSGDIDTNIEALKYGLHLQLPTYLYLINHSKLFDNPIFTGIYYQNILFDYPNYSDLNSSKEKYKYYLKGYSTDNTEILERFDSTYKKSEMIASMKYSEEKGFTYPKKILNDETISKLVEYTKKIIDHSTDDILKSKFDINPKIYNNNEDACRLCTYKDLCFKTTKDVIKYDKVEDLSFLGGEE